MKLIRRADRKNGIIGEAVLRKVKEGVIPVDEWKPESDENIYVGFSGKNCIVLFDKLFKTEKASARNVFDVSRKEAYYNQLNVITQYINYFEEFYDKDKELLIGYARMKLILDSENVDELKRSSFLKQMHKYIFSKRICKKIVQMSKDNYRVNLEPDQAKKKARKVYPPALQFNETHAEILMRISIAIKFAIPVVLHYIRIFRDKDEARNNMYRYFIDFFTNPIFTEGVNILGKLRHTINSRVKSYSKPDKAIYDKHEVLGSSIATFEEELLYRNIMTDTIFSYQFTGNIISYNSVVIRYQLIFHSKEDLRQDLLRVSDDKDADGLSGLDKMELYTTKIDQFQLLFSRVNIKKTIESMRKKLRTEITQDEIDYYIANYHFNNTSKELLFYFYAKHFGGFRDLNLVKREDYVILLIIMKRILEANGDIYMSSIVSANIQGKASSRVIRNSKFLDKIKESSIYKTLKAKKYPSLSNEKDCPIIVLLSRILNTTWTICDYELRAHTDSVLEIDPDAFSDEYLRFVDSI